LLFAVGAAKAPQANATASPTRVSIEFGADVIVVGPGRWHTQRSNTTNFTCTLSRVYGSGGYALSRAKLAPDFKKCCTLEVPATSINATAVICHIPADIPTEGNTTIVSPVGLAYFRHYASFVPSLSRRPYFHEQEGAVVVRLAAYDAPRADSLNFQVPCGGPKVDVSLQHVSLVAPTAALSPFVSYRVPFSLATVSPSCYEVMNLTLTMRASKSSALSSVTRSRTFIRAPPPNTSDPSVSTTSWQVDAESQVLTYLIHNSTITHCCCSPPTLSGLSS
jgi:hypothetical protein